MIGWHHRLNGHGFGWTPGVGDGQGGLACCSSSGLKESDTTEQLNRTELCVYIYVYTYICIHMPFASLHIYKSCVDTHDKIMGDFLSFIFFKNFIKKEKNGKALHKDLLINSRNTYIHI